MRPHILNRALVQGRAAALAHEDPLAERYRLALSQAGRIAARRFTDSAGAALTAAAPTQESAMVAVYPTLEQREALAQPNGEPAEIIHCTLAFLGELDADQAEAVAAVVAEVARQFEEGPLEGTVGGIAAFGSPSGMLAEIARIAGMVAPDGGYGQTLWNFDEEAVYWIPADWSTDDEAEAAAQAFLSVPGVESVVVLESEAATPQSDDLLLLWSNGQAHVEASYPSIVLPDVPGLAELRHAVCVALDDAGVPYSELHGWTAHSTVDYLTTPDPPPASLLGLPLTFEALSFTRGDVARDFPFGEAALVAAAPPPPWNPPHPDEILDVDEVIGRLRTKADPVRRAAIRAAALPALDEARLDWDVTNPFVAAVLDKTASEVVGIAETTRLNVLRIIRDGYEQGLSIPDTAKAIREGMTAAAESRATLIARTEMTGLSSGGALAAAQIVEQATGAGYMKQWLTADGAKDPRHEDYDGLDGQTVGIDDLFDVGGSKLAYPGDPDGPPEEVCNCRCSLSFLAQDDLGQEADGADLQDTAGELAQTESLPIGGDDLDSLAASVVARAVAIEPKLTEIMRAVVEPRGGVLDGLSFRLKTEESMARKIRLVSEQAGIPEKAAAQAMKDGNRYTAVYGPNDFATKTRSTLDGLRRAGIEPERVTSRWSSGQPYVGTNVILRAPNGVRFELQFHTPESLRTKQAVNHALYEQWRKLDPGSVEAKRLERAMVANADSVMRPKGILGWKYEPSVEADVGITPFRGGTDDPIGFYDSPRFKVFQQDVTDAARKYGVEVQAQERVAGVWEGEEEPAVALRIHDGELGVRAFAADLGKAYEQDGVLLFTAKDGEDVIATFGVTETAREAVFEAMADAGLPAGRFLEDGRLQVIGSGPEFVAKLDTLAARLRSGYDADVGAFRLLEKGNGDYEAALRDFHGAPGEQVRAGERAAEGDRGPAALKPSAEGRQGGPPQVGVPAAPNVDAARTLPQPAVPPIPEPLTPAQAKRLSVDELWKQAAELGKIENVARAEVADASQAAIHESLWQRGEGRLRKDLLHYRDLAGDQQVHSVYSDGHQQIARMAEEAQKRGQRQLVISDHSHLLSAADIEAQHKQIDVLNSLYEDFRVLKGIEVNILADGTLDTVPEVLAKFDVVNAAIHAPQQALAVFSESNTARFLKAMDNPSVTVIVHPHSVDADWNLVAKKAADKGIALEVNGRDLLRNDRQDAAAEMIAAAKAHGAKLAIGSDAHTSGDLVDVLYAVRFAAQHGVTPEDIYAGQRLVDQAGSSLPQSISVAQKTPGGFSLGQSKSLGGGMARVYKTEVGGQEFVVKIPRAPDELAEEFGMETGDRIRENIEPGLDIQREQAAYTMSRFFNEAGGDRYHVYTPPSSRGEAVVPVGGRISSTESGGLPVYERSEKVEAGIQGFVEGTSAAESDTNLQWWAAVVPSRRDEARSAALYDAIIGNTDRHVGNFIFGDDGHLWLIDHGLAFPESEAAGQFQNQVLVDYAASEFKQRLTPSEVSFLGRLLERWPEIEKALAADGLPGESVDEMKDRVERMVEGRERRPWPHRSDLGTATPGS